MPMLDEKMATQELIDFEALYGAHNYHALDVVIERARESGSTT